MAHTKMKPTIILTAHCDERDVKHMDINYYKQYEPIFGAWHITRLIGEGSFGKVFEMEREDFGVTYKAALKAITIPASQSEVRSVMSEGMDEGSVRTYFGGFVKKLVQERFGIEKFIINHVGPTIGAHSGPGTVALFFLGDHR